MAYSIEFKIYKKVRGACPPVSPLIDSLVLLNLRRRLKLRDEPFIDC